MSLNQSKGISCRNIRRWYIECLRCGYRSNQDKHRMCRRRYGSCGNPVRPGRYISCSNTTWHLTRMTLNMGGDDVTEFLYVLLERIKFPYREIDLNRSYDWAMLEDLKARICTLAEVSLRWCCSFNHLTLSAVGCESQSLRLCCETAWEVDRKIRIKSVRRSHSGSNGRILLGFFGWCIGRLIQSIP